MRTARLPALVLTLCLALPTCAASAAPVALTARAAAGCEGNACADVTLTFDGERQQYKVQNSSDRAVVVEGENLVSAARVRVGAGLSAYLPLKSIVGAYRANYE